MTCNAQSIDKALVARRFAHARDTYGSEARVQQQVAENAAPAHGARLYIRCRTGR